MITCTTCGYDKNPIGNEFCEACGAELSTIQVASPDSGSSPDLEPLTFDTVLTAPGLEETRISQPREFESPEPATVTQSDPPPAPQSLERLSPPPEPAFPTPTLAKLVSKIPGAPIPEFVLDNAVLTIGLFDPDMGPVDIDLEDFPGSETISRRHAEVYQERGEWKIKDLGSTNGIFLKRSGETAFRARITVPESLQPGDEVAIAKIRFLFQMA